MKRTRRGDPWKGYVRVKQRVTPEMSAALARRP